MNENQKSLENVTLTFSVGIGRNQSEAEISLEQAKENKGEKWHNIKTYTGDSLEDKNINNSAVESYLVLEKILKDNKEGLEHLENIKKDGLTGLLTKTGYAMEKTKLKNANKYANRIIIYLDGDYMHELNDKIGRKNVDKILAKVGQTIKAKTRGALSNDELTTDKEARMIDNIYVNRVNDSGGDEFIIDIGAKYKYAETIAKRFIDAIYNMQIKESHEKIEVA